jgi:hypothetical protein
MRRSSSNGSSISSSSTRDLSMCDLFKVLIGPMGDAGKIDPVQSLMSSGSSLGDDKTVLPWRARRNVEKKRMVTTRIYFPQLA